MVKYITEQEKEMLDEVTNFCKDYIGTTLEEMLSALQKEFHISANDISKESEKRGITEDKKIKQAEGILVLTQPKSIFLIVQKTNGKITSMEIETCS